MRPSRMRLALIAAAAALAATAHAGRDKPGKPGRVTGTIAFAGKPPKAAAVDASADPFCAKAGVTGAAVRVGDDGGLADVLVSIDGKGLRAAAPATPVDIDQTGCAYVPRVVGVVRGQALRIRNSDGTMHNVHAFVDGETAFNLAQPKQAKPVERTVEDGGVVELKCDVHPWMRAWAVHLDHAHFAVTGPSGAFELPRVPPGTYTLTAWHPILGSKTAAITVAKGKPTRADLRFGE